MSGTGTRNFSDIPLWGAGCIVADPPWQYSNTATRSAQAGKYAGMTVDEICALPVESIAAENAHLHLWTTNAFLFEAPRVMEAWGFTYKSVCVWCKPQLGIGNYWRVCHEFLLLGVKGKLTVQDKRLRSWYSFSRTKHSAKPEGFYDLIERASPGPYVDLFARRVRPGWICWGNEV